MPKAKAKTRGVTTAKRRKAIGTSSSGMMSSTSDQPSGSELGNNKIVPQAEFETEVVRTDHDDHPIPVISCQSTGLGPTFRFIHGSKSRCTTCMRITDGGQKLSMNKNPCGYCHVAVSDTSFQSGVIYWELDIQSDYRGGRYCYDSHTAGITNNPDDTYYVGIDSNYWVVGLVYMGGDYSYKYICCHGGRTVSPYKQCVTVMDDTGPITIRQGFYLNCLQRTFSIIDCTNNRLIHTFKDIDLTKALYPVVSSSSKLNHSVRLKTADDINNIPNVVYEKCVNVE